MSRSNFCCLFVISASLLHTSHGLSDEWPQWMGPNRDGVWRETGIVDELTPESIKVLWRVPVAGGYGGPAVADGKVYLMDYVSSSGEAVNDPGTRAELQGQERILCLDAETGKSIWEHAYDCPYQISYPAGPRVTPTIDDDRIYTLGAEGHLLCLSSDEGKVLWSKALKEEYKTEAPIWGFCGHPLVHDDLLICLVGGEGSVAVAFDKLTGKEVWRNLTASESGYCPPSMINAGGVNQLIIWDADHVNGLDPKSGDLYWSVPLKPNYGMSINAPRKSGNFLFASGIGHVAALIELATDKPDAKIVWQNESNKESVFCANSTPFVDESTVYGTDCHDGSLIAADLKTGERLWTTFEPTTGKRRASHGTAFLIKHADRYFLFNELGDLILANLTRDGYQELGRHHLLEPTGEAFGRQVVWSYPAFAYQSVFARNDKELVRVSLAK